MNDKWLNDLKRHMDGYETDAPEGLWEGIESALSETTAETPAPARPAVMRLWPRIASVAAILAAIVIGGDLLLRHDDSLTTIDSQIAAVAPEKTNSHSTTGTDPVTARVTDTPEKPVEKQTVSYAKATPRPIATAKSAETPATATDNPTTSVIEPPSHGETPAAETPPTRSLTTGPEEPADTTPAYPRPLPAPDRLPEARRSERRYYTEATPRQRRSDAGRISVGLNSGSGFVVDLKDYDDDLAMNSPTNLGSAADYMSSNLHEIEKREPSFDPKAESADHSLPLRIAATVSYAVTDRFSVESGLTFTSLHSDVYYSYSYDIAGNNNTNASSWKGDRNLFYLGIPVNARYTFASGSSFDFYGSGGFAVEKCVAGKTEIYCIEKDFKDADTRSFTSRVDPLQWSVRASLGIQWRIVPQFGIYFEPGISYFFNNHSDSRNRPLPISTYYTEHPFNYSFSVGVRLMLPR